MCEEEKNGPIKYKIFQNDHENVSNIRIYKTYQSNYTRILRVTLEINFNILSQSTNSLHQKMLLLHDKGTWKQYSKERHKKNLLLLVSISG